MKKPLLAFGLVALAGIGIGQATTSFIPIARWLGFYQREDISQYQLWTPHSPQSPSFYMTVTERIELIQVSGSTLNPIKIVQTPNGSPPPVLLDFDDINELSRPIIIDPQMWSVPISLWVIGNIDKGPSGEYGAYVLYRTM